MRPKPKQSTLATYMAGVLFWICATQTYPQTASAQNLAHELYSEGDWIHAFAEAQREGHPSASHPEHAPIAILAAMRLHPDQTHWQTKIEKWINTNPLNPHRDWVQKEYDKIAEASPSPRTRGPARIAQWVIHFYQHQIGPAIGDRCAMHPSCSRYSLEAIRKYGMLGIPMTADRLIRESDHIRHRINPTQQDGTEKYVDPVSNHSYWFRRNNK